MTELPPFEEMLKLQRPFFHRVSQQYASASCPQEDLFQEACIGAWGGYKSHDASKGDLGKHMRMKGWQRITKAIKAGGHMTGAPSMTGRTRPKLQPTEDLELLPSEFLYLVVPEDNDMAYHHDEIHEAIRELTPRIQAKIFKRFWLDEEKLSSWWGAKPYGIKFRLQERLAHLKGCE